MERIFLVEFILMLLLVLGVIDATTTPRLLANPAIREDRRKKRLTFAAYFFAQLPLHLQHIAFILLYISKSKFADEKSVNFCVN